LSNVRKASDWIRNTVGESAHDLARLDVPPEDVTTSNWNALEDFAQARLLLRQNRLEDAAVLLKHAVTTDPKFALAFASLGDVLRSLHRDLEAFQAYDKALELGLEDRLTRREEDRIRGMRAVDAADLELAVDAFHDLAVNYPNDPSAWTYPTVPLRLLNRNDEAIADLRRAIQIDPDGAYAPYALAQELMIRGQLDEVPTWIDYLKRRNHPDSAGEDEAILLFLDHGYDRAVDIFRSRESASSSPTMRSYSFQNLAALYADTGHDAQAIQALDAGIADDAAHHSIEEQASKLLGRAYVECTSGNFDGCLRDESAGFALNPSPEHAFTADTVLGLAFSAAPASLRTRIRRELEHVEGSLPPTQFGTISQLLKLRTRGELELAEGHPAAALHTFEALAAKDAPAGDREYLARALVAVAATEKESPASMDLVRQAEQAYAAIALHPALVLCDAMNFPPGFYRNQLSSYVALSEATHDASPTRTHAWAELRSLLSQSAEHTVAKTELTHQNR
jgi:tetratricopeptide (TPR) repeat protein